MWVANRHSDASYALMTVHHTVWMGVCGVCTNEELVTANEM